ncbi:poly(A) ribonuclease Pop2p [[Candida] jaroonii]|uniref:Poly(A) ribonuclease Pop2p n=1 Tax=[Candida] jaroonii TaxID=467808 RepID=A0ACA9YGH4_9ASCO|nr:poly(A) ribonuclease Pop2p [[Candida] jaroonii]
MNVPQFQYLQQMGQGQGQANNAQSPQVSQIQMQQQLQQRQQILNHLQQQQQQQPTNGTNPLLAVINGGNSNSSSNSNQGINMQQLQQLQQLQGQGQGQFQGQGQQFQGQQFQGQGQGQFQGQFQGQPGQGQGQPQSQFQGNQFQQPGQPGQPGQGQPGQGQPGQGQPGQGQPGQPGQVQPGQVQPGQGQPGQPQSQFQNQNFQIHPMQQLPMHVPPPQVPIVREVWNHNLEHEFTLLRNFTNDKTTKVYVSTHQEIPGIVARPVGTFKSSSDYHFQTLRSNADLLNLIQLSLCVIKINNNNEISNSIIWQFNFHFDIHNEMYNEEHLSLLSQSSQINFNSSLTDGIQHFQFSELIIESGLLLDETINWISYHGGYDSGFFLSLLMNDNLPYSEEEFQWYIKKYFPNFLDLKFIGNTLLNKSNEEKPANKPSIEYLAEELHLLPISPMIRQFFTSNSNNQLNSQQMTSTLHAYLIMECFKELYRQSGYDNKLFDNFKGLIWGLSGNAPSTPPTKAVQLRPM